ncbi:hypothetical protein PENTCL1PPCAC_16227, partial [Pristionchus entomophagus]
YLRLQPREPLAGGRTEQHRYKVVAQEGEKIYYLDVTSLYPSQMKVNEFPVGEPQVIDDFTPEEVTTVPFRGFIKGCILPPRKLRKPVLPYHCNKKLLFPLCGKCTEEENTGHCSHSDEDRALKGCCTDIEVKKAMQMGYSVKELYEVWNFPANQWKSDLYSEYITRFYKIKLCSSGWPEHCKTDEEKERFLKWHRDNMGTAYGRLKLYSLMEAVGERLIDTDTDSLIFICAKEEANPLEHLLTGYLGELTSECPTGRTIKSVMVNALKSYSIEYDDGSTDLKNKGTQQNEDTYELLTYYALESLVDSHLKGKPKTITLPQSTLSRSGFGSIVTLKFTKIVQHVNHKSAVEGTDYHTAVNVPFGYL